ncbi:alginate lyase family protein [Paenibacillus sp. HW567]|uniref:alginate lyase family protein n=1 Tax=Paenibacillus sp. HW567 TaxID=1034769 RepID=UPI000378D920|nr:alginate lyase family protein [Paenibacillus sp. HW567]
MSTYYLTHKELEQAARLYREEYPALADASLLIADRACGNELMIPYTNDLTTWIYMGDEIDWLYNPSNDPEFIWGINRHWHMLDLGKAYLLTKDEKYVQTYIRHFRGWCAQNPPPVLPYEEAVYFQQPGPWRLLETGLRVQSWISAYAYMEASELLDAAFTSELHAALEQHADYLTRYLGGTEINHAIMHMQGLSMIAGFHDLHERAPYWRQLAVERLELCQHYQIGPEGVQSELTTHYHDASIEMFGTPYLLGKLSGHPFPETYGRQLRRMASFSLAMIRPDQRSTAIGDSDWVSNGRERVAFLGAILADEDLIAQGAVSSEFLWLFGAEQYRRAAELQKSVEVQAVSQAFPQTGYYMLRDNNQYLFFDAAPMGGAHGHADALNLEWYWKRQLIFLDPGRYTYEEGEWRHYFKSTSAHNTIVVDGLDQTPYVSTQQWGLPLAECQTHRREIAEDYEFIGASHNGYMRLEQPVMHYRWVLLGKAVPLLLIIDWLDGEGSHEVQQRFQLHPGAVICSVANVTPHSAATIYYPESLVGLRMYWTAGGGQQPLPEGPQIESGRSWVSEIYGSKQESTAIAAKLTTEGSLGIATVVLPQDMNLAADEEGWLVEGFALNHTDQAVNLSLSCGSRRLDIRVDGEEILWNMQQG